jgi:hypothetical protein
MTIEDRDTAPADRCPSCRGERFAARWRSGIALYHTSTGEFLCPEVGDQVSEEEGRKTASEFARKIHRLDNAIDEIEKKLDTTNPEWRSDRWSVEEIKTMELELGKIRNDWKFFRTENPDIHNILWDSYNKTYGELTPKEE